MFPQLLSSHKMYSPTAQCSHSCIAPQLYMMNDCRSLQTPLRKLYRHFSVNGNELDAKNRPGLL